MKKNFLCSVLSVAILFSFTACSSIREEIVAALGQAPDRMQQTEISQSSQSSEAPQPKETPPPSSSTPKIIEVESSEDAAESLPPDPVEVSIPEVYGSLKIRDYSWAAAQLKVTSSKPPSVSSRSSQASKPTRTNNSNKVSSSSRASSQAEFVRKEKNYSKQNWPKGVVLATSAESPKKVYHTHNCRSASKILRENEIWYESAEEAERDGRVICKNCKK